MSSLMSRSVFTLLIFFTLTTNAAISTFSFIGKPNCSQQYSNWIQTYGDSDPFLAFQKSTPWNLNKQFMNQIIESNAKDLSQNIFISHWISSDRTPKIVDSDFYDYVNGFKRDSMRNNEIKRNLNSFYQQIVPKNTLLIG